MAVLLAEGQAVGDIAVSTGRSLATVRWNLRNIFEKHGISRQAELVRLVMSLADVPEERR